LAKGFAISIKWVRCRFQGKKNQKRGICAEWPSTIRQGRTGRQAGDSTSAYSGIGSGSRLGSLRGEKHGKNTVVRFGRLKLIMGRSLAFSVRRQKTILAVRGEEEKSQIKNSARRDKRWRFSGDSHRKIEYKELQKRKKNTRKKDRGPFLSGLGVVGALRAKNSLSWEGGGGLR